MGAELDTAKLIWSIMEAGKPKVEVARNRVSVLPQGMSKRDLPGPWSTASYTEHLKENAALNELMELLGFDTKLIDYAVTAVWDYNGQYISEFRVTGSGRVQPHSNLSVEIETFEADYTGDDIVEMNYDIVCQMSNIGDGSNRVVIHAQARGDGSGMSLNIE